MPPGQRWVLPYILSECDDDGTMKTSERGLAAAIGVGRQVVRTALNSLRADGAIRVEGSTHGGLVVRVVNYSKYREMTAQANPPTNPPTTTPTTVPATTTKKQDRKPMTGSLLPPEPAVISLQCLQDQTYHVSRSTYDEWSDCFPGVDVMVELRKAVAWVGANPANRKTVTGASRYFFNWLSKAQNKARRTDVPVKGPEPSFKNRPRRRAG